MHGTTNYKFTQNYVMLCLAAALDFMGFQFLNKLVFQVHLLFWELTTDKSPVEM
jgi:hypothetical protein